MLVGWAGRWSIEITLRCLTKRAARPYRLTDPEHELIGPGIEPIAECSRFSRSNGIGARAKKHAAQSAPALFVTTRNIWPKPDVWDNGMRRPKRMLKGVAS